MKKIKIGHKVFKISYKEDLYHEGDECYGLIYYDDNVIMINNQYKKGQQEETLIHEILHGISTMYELDLSEEQVTMLAKALYITIKDNKLR